MEFNNTYIVEENVISTLLDNVDNFITKMDNFFKEKPIYEYKIEIYKNKELDIWVGEVNIKRNEISE